MTAIRQITIPKPCRQSWQQMLPNDDGRHCNHCSKTVIDFTKMTNGEIISYLSNRSNICGRFSPLQLDSVNTHLNYQNLKTATSRKKGLVAMAMLGSSIFYEASGQTIAIAPGKIELSSQENNMSNFPLGKIAANRALEKKIEGQILDDDCKPLYGATIRVPGTDIALPTDTNGRFKLHVSAATKHFTVSFVGFETETIAIENAQNRNYEVKLTPNVVSMNDVVIVKGYPSHSCTSVLGSVETVKKHSWWWRMFNKYIRQPIGKIFK